MAGRPLAPSKQPKRERAGNIIKIRPYVILTMLHNICVYISVAWIGDRPSFNQNGLGCRGALMLSPLNPRTKRITPDCVINIGCAMRWYMCGYVMQVPFSVVWPVWSDHAAFKHMCLQLSLDLAATHPNSSPMNRCIGEIMDACLSGRIDRDRSR